MKKCVFFVILALLAVSCYTEPPSEESESGFVSFQLTSEANKMAFDVFDGPSSFMLSIKKWKWWMVYEREIVELYRMGEGYISEPLALKGGKYELMEFLVLNGQKQVIYATPVEGSKKAYLVDDPLPIEFHVNKCETTTVTPEILYTEGAEPEDFGYGGYSFDVVETIVFKVRVYEWTEEGKELTEAKITVSSGEDTLYTGDLEAETNEIEVRDRYGTYKVTVEKEGYDSYEETFTDEELRECFFDPLTIYFGEPLTHSISGRVTFDNGSGGIGFRGVTMTLSGAASATVTTDASGNYAFSDLHEGESYTVSASKPGYFFSPDWSGTLSDDVTDADFTATGPAYTISGWVWGDFGFGVSGVEMTLDTTPALTVFAEEWGGYTTAPVPNGTYTLTPSLAGSQVAFYPSEKTVTVDGFNLTDENFHTTFVYSVSGTFSYSGSKTGWVYVNVINEWDWPTGEGTSIEVKYKEPGSESWDFTVRGVRPGNYTLTARMDTIGLSNPVASMPSGSSGVFMVEGSDITGLSITLEDPAPITPEAPAIMEAFPSNQSAWIVYETPHDDDDNEIAQSYNVYWSTDPGVSKASNEGEGSVPAGDMDFLIASGLTDGEEYYFVMTAVANGTESVESETFGPVKIGAATGDWTVSGTITYSQAATGPMYVLLYGEAAARATYIASPTSSQPYSISGVPEGTYMFAVLVDMNDNGYMEWTGDIHVGFEGEIEIEVSGNTTQDLSIGFLPNASVVAATSHWKDSWGEGYGLDFKIESMLKQVVKASLVSGPGIPGVIDIGFMHGDWEGIGLDFYTTSPGVGDTYTFDFTYSDGTTESLQASVTAVLDSFATPISPIGDVFGPTATHPTFEWAPPDPPPLSYGYDIDVWEFMGGHIWWADEIPSSETSVEFNFNDEAEQDPLFPGVPYQWSITVIDDYGNSASSGSVEFTPW